MNYNYILIGGSGFIGSALLGYLTKKTNVTKVYVVTRNCTNQVLSSKWQFYTSLEALSAEFQGPIDRYFSEKFIFIYLISPIMPRSTALDFNILVKNEVDRLKSWSLFAQSFVNLHKFIYLSSGGAIYGNSGCDPVSEDSQKKPMSQYGHLKSLSEDYIHSIFYRMNDKLLVLRPGNVYGSAFGRLNNGVVNVFLNRIINGEKICIIGGGRQRKDYIYIRDFVDALVSLAESQVFGTFNVSNGHGVNTLKILNIIESLLNVKADCVYLPEVDGDVNTFVLNITRLKMAINYAPSFSMEHGILDMINKIRDS